MATSNEIVAENELPGNPVSQWGIHGSINGVADTNIEGFATNISVDVGQEVDFKINTDSDHYRIEIYRLGYYGGDGARLVATIEHNTTSATVQPAAIVDPSTGVVDAGDWSVTNSWQAPANAVSGVYVAKLVREDGTVGENQIPFIVRDDSSHSDIIFQTSDETWQAYNTWGGSSLYASNVGNPQLDAAADDYARAYGVSYNRPLQSTSLVNGSVFSDDYASIYWLEKNGYDVTYQAGVDTAANGSLLLNHQVFMDAGHDEYWSTDQRANVQAARDAGVNLAFMAGNLMYWETRWGPGIDGTPNRTLITYKESTTGTDTDPSPIWTGEWRDPNQPGGPNPENALTGSLFMVNGNISPLTLSSAYSQYHLWANTAVANLKSGQSISLPGLLGYEWDVNADNGFQPAGLINLSSTTVLVDTLVTPDSLGVTTGNATNSLTLYRAASGALVFSAGSIFYSWGLDTQHATPSTWTVPAASPDLQQFMVNLLAEMHVRPATLQSGLVPGVPSTDFTPPETRIGSLNAHAGSLVVGGLATDFGGGVVAGTEISTDGGASWHPATESGGQWLYNWVPSQAGEVTVLARSVDDSVNLGAASALPIELETVASGTKYVTQLDAQVASALDSNTVQTDALPAPVYAIIGGGDAGSFTIDSQTGVLSFVAAPDYSRPTDYNKDNVYEVWVSASGSWDGGYPVFVSVTPPGGASAPAHTTIWSLNASANSFVVTGYEASLGGSTEVSTDGGVTWHSAVNSSTTWAYWWTPTQPDFTILARSTAHNVNSTTPATLPVEFDTVAAGTTYVTTLTDPNAGSGPAPVYAIVGGADENKLTIDSQTGVLSFVAPPDLAHPTDLSGDNIYEIWVSTTGSWDGAHPLFVRVAPGDGGTSLHTSILSLNSFAGWLVFGGTAGDFDGSTITDTQISTDGGVTWHDALGTTTWSYWLQPTQSDFTLLARSVDSSGHTGSPTALTVDLDSVVSNSRYVTTVADTNAGSGATPDFAIIGGGDASKFSIDSHTGVLSFNAAPDYTHPTDLSGDNVYEIWVSDTGSWDGAHPLFVTVTPAVTSQTLTGDSGDNTFYGSPTTESFVGQGGNDTVSYTFASAAVTASLADPSTNTGDAAHDTYNSIENLIGSSFNDTLSGNSGANVLQGGLGADKLAGGGGNDTFVYRSAAEGGDTIQDFVVANDTLSFSASGFGGGLVAGQHLVAGTTFVADAAPAATTNAGTFLYDTTTHDLLWDADGTGGGAAVQIAHFDTAVTLTPDHFDITT